METKKELDHSCLDAQQYRDALKKDLMRYLKSQVPDAVFIEGDLEIELRPAENLGEYVSILPKLGSKA